MEHTNNTLPEWFDYLELGISYTCMVFVILTLPLYVLVVTIMIYLRQHAYKGMFYRIFMIGGVIDIIALINNYLGAIFPAKGWFNEYYMSQGTTIGHIYLITAWSTRCIQGFTVTLLALNRATARSMASTSNAYLNHKIIGEKQRQENNLTIVSLVTCAIEITYYMYIIYAFAIQPYMNTRVFYLIYNMLNDIYGGISAWLIVTLSKIMQIHLKNLFRYLSFAAQKRLHVMAPSTLTLITIPNRSWINRYIVCKKPSDVNSPILMIFKSKKDRQMNNLKMSFVLQNYVGFESGFELYRSCNTLALITKEDIIIFSFMLAETLVLWETWLKAICGSSSYFFMQLQRAPTKPEFAPLLFKEVKCHLHDCRLAVVHGRPHKLMLYCDIISAEINVADNNLITIRPSMIKTNDSFTFLCARSATFKTLLTKAMNEKGLHRYLSKHQTEGDWMPEFIIPYNKPADSESQFSQTLSGLFNFFTITDSPKPFKKPNLDKEKSKSGLHFGNGVVQKQLTSLARTNSLAIYYNTTRRDARDDSMGNYVNVSRHGSPLSEREITKGAQWEILHQLVLTLNLDMKIGRRQRNLYQLLSQSLNRIYNIKIGRYAKYVEILLNLQSLTKSSSTGALQFAPAVTYYSGHISSGSMSEFDEPPPSLDFAVSEKMPTQIKENDEAPPEGLVRPKEEILIKARAGVGAILARRLASSIRGSFSKYDGERATHHYQADGPQEVPKAASPPMIEALDGIEAAVNRGQDRLKESDRRASNVSFHKQNPSSSMDSLNSEQTARSDSPPQLPQRVKNNSRSSSNSLQSDTSIHTTKLVNYCAITAAPAIPSSSSSNSVSSRVEYVLIDPVTTKAAREAACMHLSPFERSRVISSSMNGMSTLRRKSQGQSSTSDSISLGQPTRQGFFRKYRKMRRNKKTAASMSQLNV
uniref:G protein-coupled receptor n=1 Tax=Heterorhabditis bacteriophora TaxID=37862 RepID=A0A1I7XNL5_HETBA